MSHHPEFRYFLLTYRLHFGVEDKISVGKPFSDTSGPSNVREERPGAQSFKNFLLRNFIYRRKRQKANRRFGAPMLKKEGKELFESEAYDIVA